MTTEDTEVIGVAPEVTQRDPDGLPVIIDLSGRPHRGVGTPEPTTASMLLAAAPIGQIRAEPVEPVEPATVAIEVDPVTVPLIRSAVGIVRKARGRARVYPRIRRKPRPAAVVGHRRRLRRASLRVWETVAWVAALGVIATVAGFVIHAVPASAPLVAPHKASAATVREPSAQCVIVGCPRVYPPGPPTRVRIPAIGVDSTLESLTLNRSTNVLQVPTSYDRAGWFADGVVPGDRGPAIIAGHVDSAAAGPGVFFKLSTLQQRATISVQRGGTWVTFTVYKVEKYPKDEFPTHKVYDPTVAPELRVITCGGDFDNVHKRYYDNIVVYAVLIN